MYAACKQAKEIHQGGQGRGQGTCMQQARQAGQKQKIVVLHNGSLPRGVEWETTDIVRVSTHDRCHMSGG